MNILITGGTGFIGRALCQHLLAASNQVTVLTRNKTQAEQCSHTDIRWVSTLDEIEALCELDVIINLAGENLADGRWSVERKTQFTRSRVEITDALIGLIERLENKPKLLISGSAIGYYGDQQDVEVNEDTMPHDEFTHTLCKAWEDAAKGAEAFGVRVCLLRTGIVLGPGGGALKAMLLPFKLGLGGRMGSGEQWMSWIHLNDLIGIILHLINHESMSGPVNGTAPSPVRNADFARVLGKVLRRPTITMMPGFVLKLMLGEMSHMLLTGQQVIPRKALDTGYSFQFDQLHDALVEILHS